MAKHSQYPDPDIEEDLAVIPGLDGQKMSKSYGNTINIFAQRNELKKRVMSIVTDSTPVEEPKNPDTCNLFTLYKLFASPDAVQHTAERYRQGGIGYGEVKQELIELIWNHFAPYRERRAELAADRTQVRHILLQGADKARYHANRTLQKVRKKAGSTYFKDK